MKGIVINLPKPNAAAQLVELLTEYGTLQGLWDGPLPPLSATVHVELEFELDGEVVESVDGSFCSRSPNPKAIALVGIAEAWNDGILDLRVGQSLVQIEMPHAPPLGHWLIAKGHELRICDMNL